MRPSLDTFTDEELLQRCADGQEHAERHASFELFAKRYVPALRGYLRRYLGCPHLADDAMQEALLRIYQRSGQFDATRKASSWIYTIATRTAIDFLRRQGRRPMLSLEQVRGQAADKGEEEPTLSALVRSELPNPQDEVIARESALLFREAANRLPEFLRLPFLMCEYRHLQYDNIAELMGIPIGTVKSRIATARKRLFQMLEDDGYFAESSLA